MLSRVDAVDHLSQTCRQVSLAAARTFMATSMDILIFFALAILAMAECSTPATPGDTFLVPQSRDEHAGVREIKLASANSSQPILLSRDGAYAWKFFQSYGNATQRLLVVLSTLFNTTVVWMANRDLPVSPQATLLVTPLPSRSLVLRDADGTVVWSPKVANISAIVMNSTGNLFILTGGASASENPKWQSFDEPSDVLLPGQYVKPAHTSTASLAWNDWRSGHYTLRADPGGAVLYATFDAQQTMIPFSVLNYIISNTSFTASLHSACNHTSILYNADATGVTLLQQGNISAECLQEDRNSVHGVKFSTRIAGDGFRYMRVMPTGDIDSFFLSNSTGLRVDNELFKGFYSTYCKLPSYCGVNGVCSSVQTCTCPELFEAMEPNDPTQGCRLQTPLNCTIFRQHKFVQISGAYYFANPYLPPRKIVDNPTECTDLCLENCSCTAAFYNNNTGSCHLYDQIRTVEFGTSPQVTAFLRVAALPPTTTYNGKHYQGRKIIIGVTVGAAMAIIVLAGLFGFVGLKMMKRREQENSDSEEEAFLEGLPGLPPRFSYKDLHNATDGFSKSLGAGGSGSVYEGTLYLPVTLIPATRPEDNLRDQQQRRQLVKVAVKELIASEHSNIAAGSRRQFRAEIATLGNISHVNLVQLKGFCAEGTHRLLVYEFEENGSLDRWVFPKTEGKTKGSLAAPLSWELRYSIAVDTARGLAFLHERTRAKVVHLDIKPQNILLDASFRAKLADFGLSKLIEMGRSQTMTAMRGTPGYMAPEWFMNLPITDKSDVFSYGMVLLELVGGRKNLDPAATSSEDWYFPAWAVKQTAEGRLRDVIDKRIMEQLLNDAENGKSTDACGEEALEKMERLAKVALWCIQEDAGKRPPMRDVVLMLEEHLQVQEPPLETTYIPGRRRQRRHHHHHHTSPQDSRSSFVTRSNSRQASDAEVTLSLLSAR